jgi:hypothetical protein
MLPTDNESKLLLDSALKSNNLECLSVARKGLLNGMLNQHLYIISDDKFKAPCYVADKRGIYPITVDLDGYIGLLKVIASTDSSLETLISYDSSVEDSEQYKSIYSIPQLFIDKYVSEYNKGNKIEDVMVEYIDEQTYITAPNSDEKITGYVHYLKLNPDNTINIKSVKDSWTREEVVNLMWAAYKESNTIFNNEESLRIEFDEWIESNLI